MRRWKFLLDLGFVSVFALFSLSLLFLSLSWVWVVVVVGEDEDVVKLKSFNETVLKSTGAGEPAEVSGVGRGRMVL